jgi:uncharacterized protein
MYIDLDKLSDGFKKFDETIEVALNEESVQTIKPVRILGELKKGIVQVDLEGKIEALVEIECSRCLSPVQTTLEIFFEVGYITEKHYTKEKEKELHGDDLGLAIYDGVKIDLTELTIEQILLNLPTQVFCQEKCLGLCPNCGANLNQNSCNCETKEIDPRWQSLRQLKIKN